MINLSATYYMTLYLIPPIHHSNPFVTFPSLHKAHHFPVQI